LAWSAWISTTQDTSLAALGNDLVHNSVGCIVHIKLVVTVAELEWVHDLAEIGLLAIFDVSDVHNWSSKAEDSAGAWSFDLKESTVVDLEVSVSELNSHLERSAGTSEGLSSTAVRLFLSSEDFNTGLFTRLVDGMDEVGVLSFTATGNFGDVDLLLDVDSFLVSKSIETREMLGWSLEVLLLLLRRIATLLWRIATLLWRIATLLWGIATLLWRVSTLLLRKH